MFRRSRASRVGEFVTIAKEGRANLPEQSKQHHVDRFSQIVREAELVELLDVAGFTGRATPDAVRLIHGRSKGRT